MSRHPVPRGERGAVAVVVAIVLLAIGGFTALALNVGHMVSVRTQLQRAADAGALAGAARLTGRGPGLERARATAQDFVERHTADRVPLRVDPNPANDPAGDVVLGHWDATQPKALAFTPIPDPAAEPRNVNAVLVRVGREERRGTALEVFLSVFLGPTRVDVTADSVAVGGGACRDCAAPFTFADCLIETPSGDIDCGRELVFTSATVDNIGLTNLTPRSSAVNPPTIIDILNGNCGSVKVGDEIGVGNGNDLNNNVIDALLAYIERNGPQLKAPIVSPSTCPDPQFNRLQPVVGFATFTVLEVQGAPNRLIRIELDCDVEDADAAPSGCEMWGTNAAPRLVR